MRAICPQCTAPLEMTQSLYFDLTDEGVAEVAVRGIGDWALSCQGGHVLAETSGLEDFTEAQPAADSLLASLEPDPTPLRRRPPRPR